MTLLTEGKSTVMFRPKSGGSFTVFGKNFVIRDEDKKIREKFPSLAVRDILIFGDTCVHEKIFSLARKNNIPIHFLDGKGKFLGSVRYDFSQNVFLRSAQFLFHNDEKKRLTIAQKFVETKIHNQKIFLQKIRSPADFLNTAPEKISQTKNIESLRGIEGSFAKLYFSEWKISEKIIKNKKFSFTGRWKNPPLDEINAFLGFAYTLFHHELVSQLMIAGLDPYVGFLHDQKYGHSALASDFIEIYRGIIEHWVIKQINLKEFSPEDFDVKTGGIYRFSKSGFGKFFPKWMKFLRYEKFENDLKLVAVIERDVRKLVHFLMEDANDFTPFKWHK